jgi:dTDP-4-amino-4,6-dideoxygalactose transaminase
MFKKTLISHFLTTINFKMALKATWFLFLPWKWLKFYNWKSIKNIENKLLNFLNLENSKIISFYNWRSAIFHWIKLLWIWKWDEILTQAFTCIAVSNPIIQSWSTPIYCDVDLSLNISLKEIKKNFTKKTKAVLVQNTFWNPADIKNIKNFCKEKNIFLIEDCAHSLWSEFNWKKLWSFWDISIFSFWRDKVISSINWGFLVINNSKFFEKSKKIILKNILLKELLKNLFYTISSFKSKVFYDFFSLWKVILFLWRKLKIVPEIIEEWERECKNLNLSFKYPNALAEIWEMEFENNLKRFNFHRENIFIIYKKNLKNLSENWKIIFTKNNFWNYNWRNIFFRIAVFVKKSKNILKLWKKEKIIFWDRYRNIIDPIWSSFKHAKYDKWSCKNAEKFASEVINLPNHFWIWKKDALRVCKFLEKNL